VETSRTRRPSSGIVIAFITAERFAVRNGVPLNDTRRG
jgi:hypothetical protein